MMLAVDTEQQIARLRTEADAGHPAGPLYVSGEFAEADMMAEELVLTPVPHCPICTIDSSSKIGQCCC
jgi:hypothetical protein